MSRYSCSANFGTAASSIQLFLSGTAYVKVMAAKEPTMFTFKYIPNRLLSLRGVMSLVGVIAERIGNTQKWWLHLPFLQLLSDLGGLPRPVSYFLEHCFGPGPDHQKGKAFFDNLLQAECFPIFNDITRSVQDAYGIESFIAKNQQAATQVLRHSLCALPVRLDTILSNVVVEKMELDGHVFLERIEEGWLLFKMPVLFICIYNRFLSIIPRALMQPFSQDTTFYWQSWEKFNAFFEAFVTNTHVSLGTSDMELGSLIWGAYGSDQTLKTRVKIQTVDVVQLVHQFPSTTFDTIDCINGSKVDWKSGHYLLLNGRNAQFGDTISFREEVGTGCRIILSGQEKWDYNGHEFTAASALYEHTKAQATAAQKLLSGTIVTACFTSQPLDNTALPGKKYK